MKNTTDNDLIDNVIVINIELDNTQPENTFKIIEQDFLRLSNGEFALMSNGLRIAI